MASAQVTDALLLRYAPRLLGSLTCRNKKFKGRDPNDDPLFRLQTIARLDVQYNLADVVASPGLLHAPALLLPESPGDRGAPN